MAQSSASITQTRAKAYGPLEFHAGEDVTIDLEINILAGTDESLASDTLIWHMRRQGNRLTSVKKETGDGITHTGESTGVATITIDSADTDNLEPGIYEHQLWLKDSSGDYEEIMRGLIRLQSQQIFGTAANAFEEA